VRLLVKRDGLTGTVNRLLAELDVADLTVTDPPIEEVIGRAFNLDDGKASKAKAATLEQPV
jgi:ABC-2 type transport system ATP-binding protein